MNLSSPKSPSTAALVLAFATIYLAWGSTYLGMKVAVETMPPYAMAAVRFLLSGAILLGVGLARGLAWPKPRQWRDNLGVGVLLLLGGNGLVAWAGQFMPSGVTALLLGASPLFMVLVEWAWPGGVRPVGRVWGGLALGLAGVAWLAAPWENPAQGGWPVAGLVALLIACVAWAVGSIASRRSRDPAPVLVAAAVQMLGGGLALAVVALATGEMADFALAEVSRASLGAWAYLVIVSLVAFPTYAWLMQNSTPARVSTYAYVNPVIALFLGWLLLDEALAPRTAAAAALIVLSVVVIKLPAARRSQRRPDATREATGEVGSWLGAVAQRLNTPHPAKS